MDILSSKSLDSPGGSNRDDLRVCAFVCVCVCGCVCVCVCVYAHAWLSV